MQNSIFISMLLKINRAKYLLKKRQSNYTIEKTRFISKNNLFPFNPNDSSVLRVQAIYNSVTARIAKYIIDSRVGYSKREFHKFIQRKIPQEFPVSVVGKNLTSTEMLNFIAKLNPGKIHFSAQQLLKRKNKEDRYKNIPE